MKAIACLAAFAVLGSLPIEEYDILITNGDVIDGTGQPGVELRIAIRGDTIVAIGPDVEGSADRIIDARDSLSHLASSTCTLIPSGRWS